MQISRRMGLLAGLGCLLCVCSAALAGGLEDLLRPPVSTADHERIVAILGLDENQRDAASLLFSGYLAGYSGEAQRFRDLYTRREEAVRAGDADMASLNLAFDAAFTRFCRKKDFASRDYTLSVRALLTEAQQASSWERVERLMRRKLLGRVFPRTATDWHTVDVVAGVEELGLPEPILDTVSDTLREYEKTVDAPLIRLERLLGSPEAVWLEQDEATLWKEGQGIGREIAAINRKYTRWIAELLPVKHSAALVTAARAKAYWSMGVVQAAQARRDELHSRLEAVGGVLAEQAEQVRASFEAFDKAADEIRSLIVTEYDQADEQVRSWNDEEWAKIIGTSANPCERVRTDAFNRCDAALASLKRTLSVSLNADQRSRVWPEDR